MKMIEMLKVVLFGLMLLPQVSRASLISIFTGGDVGEGIDFSGDVVHAFNLGGGGTSAPAAPDILVSGIVFKDVYASGNLIPNVAPVWAGINNWGTRPSYPAPTTNDENLSEIMWDITHGANAPTLEISNLQPNQLFKMQVLASDNGLTVNRGSSYEFITGTLASGTVVDSSLNNNLTQLQNSTVNTGVVITMMGSSDPSGILSFRAVQSTGFVDNNSIASAFILTAVPEASSFVIIALGGTMLFRLRSGVRVPR